MTEDELVQKRASRKWRAFLYAFWASTILLILSSILESLQVKFVLIDGMQWVSFNTLVYGTYVTGNVIEKRHVQ